MKLVIDSNVLFTFFWEDSVIRNILTTKYMDLVSPEFALGEINKYQDDIIRKAKISKNKFQMMREELSLLVDFIPIEDYEDQLKNAIKISPDPDDVDFFALALKNSCSIWSNDSDLKKQSAVDVLNTKEIIELLD